MTFPEELKKCPFCGSDAKMHTDIIRGVTSVFIECDLCDCRKGPRPSERDAISAWNDRESGPALQTLIDNFNK